VSYPFSERVHTSKQVCTLSKLKIPPLHAFYLVHHGNWGDNLRRFECHSKRGGGTDWPIRIVSATSPSPFRLSQIPLTWHSVTEVVTSGAGTWSAKDIVAVWHDHTKHFIFQWLSKMNFIIRKKKYFFHRLTYSDQLLYFLPLTWWGGTKICLVLAKQILHVSYWCYVTTTRLTGIFGWPQAKSMDTHRLLIRVAIQCSYPWRIARVITKLLSDH
jgi:hypothetical protein